MSDLTPATTHNEPIRMDMQTVQGFEALQRCAKLLSNSPLVPKDFQGTAGLASCVIALNLASRIQADPLMVIQNLYVVHGRPGWSSKFLIACFNQCGKFSALRYQFEGEPGTDGYGCRAWAIEKATGEKLTGPLVTLAIAKEEGWTAKNGSKWRTMPDQMLRYRSAAWFINTIAPELAMGLPAADEVEDYTEAEVIEDHRPAKQKQAAAAVTTTESAWQVEHLERFEEHMEAAYKAFSDAGAKEAFNDAFAAKWRSRKGKGDPLGTLRDMETEVKELTMPVADVVNQAS